MASLITKIFVAALAAGAVNALPADMQASTSVAATPTPSVAAAPPATPNNDELIKDLKGKSTAVKRFQEILVDGEGNLLSAEEIQAATVFDFNGATPATGAKGGAVKAANIDTFPILTGLGISTTLAFLEPCGINTPHIHPRATEFLTVVDGSIDFGYILENGLVKEGNSEVAGTVGKFQGTVFPQGSIHYQFNNNCAPATFVATLNSEDPGTSQIAQNFFGLNSEVVSATLGYPKSIDGSNIEEFRSKIPANLAQAVDTCLTKCQGYYSH